MWQTVCIVGTFEAYVANKIIIINLIDIKKSISVHPHQQLYLKNPRKINIIKKCYFLLCFLSLSWCPNTKTNTKKFQALKLSCNFESNFPLKQTKIIEAKKNSLSIPPS